VDATATNPPIRASVLNDGTIVAGAGAMQQVGGIDPNTGTNGLVLVSDGATLTANHINQNLLVIGNGSTFALAPSDAMGNPTTSALAALGQNAPSSAQSTASSSSGGFALANSLAPSSSFVSSGASLIGGANDSAQAAASLGGSVGSAAANAVPEPSTMLLLGLGGLFGAAALARTRRKLGLGGRR
jgi:hypothetical protein